MYVYILFSSHGDHMSHQQVAWKSPDPGRELTRFELSDLIPRALWGTG